YYSYGYEGIIGMFTPANSWDTVRLYRAHNSVDHFYTISWSEMNGAVSNYGYVYDQIAGWVYANDVPGMCPLYRTRVGAHHFYTSSPTECDTVLAGGGIYEGVAGYILPYGSTCPT